MRLTPHRLRHRLTRRRLTRHRVAAGRYWRPAAVLLNATALAGGVEAVLWRLTPSTAPAELAFDHLLTQVCAGALAACTLWAWVCVITVVWEAVRHSRTVPLALPVPPAPTTGLTTVSPPAALRRIVLALCGIALASTASPALAAEGTDLDPAPATARSLEAIAAALPFPDRASDSTSPPPSVATPRRPQGATSHPSVIVRSGQSLWSIAAAALADRGHPTDARTVDRHWRELYRLNKDVIGPEPDRLQPGQQLRLPRSLR